MERFLSFAIPGIPYGCTYALFAVGLVLTYQATGVFNFAYAAQAYTSGFFYAWLIQIHNFPVWAAFLISVGVVAPGLGLLLDASIFRHIAPGNTTAKIVTGLSLLVGIPTVIPVIFGTTNTNLYAVPAVGFKDSFSFNLFRNPKFPITGFDCSSVILTVVMLVALVVLMRYTSLGLRMRGAVESRRLVQLEGVNAGRVVASAWAISGVIAGVVGVLIAAAPTFTELQSQTYITLMVAAIASAAWGVLRSMPIAAGVAVLLGVLSLTAEGYLTPNSIWHSAAIPALPFVALVGALLFVPGLRTIDQSKDPLASVDPPVPPTTASIRTPQLDKIIRVLWWVLLAAFVVSMLTWVTTTWVGVFNGGLALSTIFLSVTLITGMGGQLSLAQASLAGVGAFVAGQLANHLGFNILVGGLFGAAVAAAVAVVLAILSLRLKGLGLALMTVGAALFFDKAVFPQKVISKGTGGITIPTSWYRPFDFANSNGHAYFILAMLVLSFCVVLVLLVRSGTTGRFLAAMRGSEVGAAGIGINLTWERVVVFALSGGIAGLGGTLYAVHVGVITPADWTYEWSLIFVVIVVTTGVTTVEGAIQGGIGFAVITKLLTYAPTRFQGMTVVLFAFGALTYALHPEGVLEFQKRKWTLRFENLLFNKQSIGDAPPALAASNEGLP